MFSNLEITQLSHRRALRGLAYAMLALAGACGFVLWPRTLGSLLGLMTFVWAAFLLVGGLLGVWGSLWDRWLGELAGIPLLVSALCVYGTALWVSGRTAVAGAIGSLMWALAFSLLGRWRDVRGLVKAAQPTDRT